MNKLKELSNPECKDCNGTGLIEVRTVKFGNFRDHEIVGYGDPMLSQCHCID